MSPSNVSDQLENVSVKLKANIYFDGGVVSHTITAGGGPRRTIGLIRPGTYHFTTDAPEQMDIIAGSCKVKQAGESSWKNYAEGSTFSIPGKSSFDISVEKGLAEYLCTFRS